MKGPPRYIVTKKRQCAEQYVYVCKGRSAYIIHICTCNIIHVLYILFLLIKIYLYTLVLFFYTLVLTLNISGKI